MEEDEFSELEFSDDETRFRRPFEYGAELHEPFQEQPEFEAESEPVPSKEEPKIRSKHHDVTIKGGPESPAFLSRINGPEGARFSFTQKIASILAQEEGKVDTVLYPELVPALVEKYNSDNPHAKVYAKMTPTRGFGVFAREKITKGSEIGIYPGSVVSSTVGKTLPDEYDKVMKLDDEHDIVGNIQNPANFNVMPLMNDPGYEVLRNKKGKVESFLGPHQRSNVINEKKGEKIVIVATKDIKKNSELLFFYGHEYWQGVKDYYPTEEEMRNAQKDVEKSRRGEERTGFIKKKAKPKKK